MSENAPDVQPDRAMSPTALTVAQIARLLGVAEQRVREHVADGAPVSADGMINLVHYTAWLNRRLRQRDGD
jgi:plasmid maintenance system antidote protein VapI